MRDELVSVVVPAFNAEDYVGDTLQSVLEQTHTNVEVLVVDDGSTDGTASIVQSMAAKDGRVRLLHQPNQGVATARNYGIEVSRGDFVATIDADDVWSPQKIEKQLRQLIDAGPRAGLCYCWTLGIDKAGFVTYFGGRHHQEGNVFSHHLRKNFIGNASVPLFRKTCLGQIGGYRPQLRERGGQGCEDWDLSLRMAERYEFCVVPEYLVGYRTTSGSMSWDHDQMLKSYELMIEDLLSRRADIASADLRVSRSNFLLYLVRYRLRLRRYWYAAQGLGQAAVLNPAVVAEQISLAGYGRTLRLCYFLLRKHRQKRRPFEPHEGEMPPDSDESGSQNSQVAVRLSS